MVQSRSALILMTPVVVFLKNGYYWNLQIAQINKWLLWLVQQLSCRPVLVQSCVPLPFAYLIGRSPNEVFSRIWEEFLIKHMHILKKEQFCLVILIVQVSISHDLFRWHHSSLPGENIISTLELVAHGVCFISNAMLYKLYSLCYLISESTPISFQVRPGNIQNH